MNTIIFLAPVFKERIWGGTLLKKLYHYDIPSPITGECWAISAHPEGESVVLNGPYLGQTLSQVYLNHRELFSHCEAKTFPLLTKIIDANQDLSVQVHPDDAYASLHTSDNGKTECWYVLYAKADATMIYGHRATSKAEFIDLVQNGQWDDLLIKRPVKTGDFIYVPAGTIHALCQGTMVLETQQSSDTTYRLYDYDRVDKTMKKRDLHLQQSIDVTTIPHIEPTLKSTTTTYGLSSITQLIQSDHFVVEKWDVNDSVHFDIDRFYLVSVIEGEGTINSLPIKKGQHFIITSLTKALDLQGHMTFIVSYL